MLQVFGFFLVAWGIRQLRQSFGRPSLIKIVAQWLQLLLSAFRRPKAQTISLSGIAAGISFGNARFVVKAGKESSLERRIEVLEQNLYNLRGEFQQKANKLETKLTEATNALENEKSQRSTEIKDVTLKIEEIAVGGLQLEIVGWFWLVLGTIGSNLAEEISTLISLTF
jgi:hypothetical protein